MGEKGQTVLPGAQDLAGGAVSGLAQAAASGASGPAIASNQASPLTNNAMAQAGAASSSAITPPSAQSAPGGEKGQGGGSGYISGNEPPPQAPPSSNNISDIKKGP